MLSIGCVVMFLLNVFLGAVDIPPCDVVDVLFGRNKSNDALQYIVLQSRLPAAITSMLSGGALALCGLMLQAVFRNPLADPSILGISSGAGLGAAIIMLLWGGSLSIGTLSLSGFTLVLMAAFIGASLVTLLMLFLSTIFRHGAMLLIAGVMVGYLSSSVIILLNFFASEDGIRAYTQWGMGNFASVSVNRMPLFAAVSIGMMLMAMLLVKPLNVMLLGSQYAQNLGINTKMLRTKVLFITGLITALTTSFCGPIAFIGLAVPHMARLSLRTDDFRFLMPATLIIGSLVALTCNLLGAMALGGSVLPINALTPLFGAPVIIYIMMKKRL